MAFVAQFVSFRSYCCVGAAFRGEYNIYYTTIATGQQYLYLYIVE